MFPARVLLVTDGSKESAPAVRVAVELAKGTGSELHVAHVISTKPRRPYPRRWEKGRRAALLDAVRVAALTLLEEKVRQVEEMGGVVVGSHYAEGELQEKVARLAEELRIDLIITGGRRSGSFGRLFSGGFAEALFRRARCAVVVCGCGGARSEGVVPQSPEVVRAARSASPVAMKLAMRAPENAS